MKIAASFALLGTLMVLPQTASAQEYPWCAQYTFSNYNCGFTTRAQCLATVSGVGGFCNLNPRYRPTVRPKRRHR